MPQCERQYVDGEVANCPPNTQIGTLTAVIREHGQVLGPAGAVYNLKPAKGYAASFGFAALGFDIIENATLIPGGAGGYRVSVVTNNVPKESLLRADETIWGVPADPSHDEQRECIVEGHLHVTPCSTEAPLRPFLTLPTSCAPQLPTTLAVDFTSAPGSYFEEPAGSPTLVGCEAPDFHPSISLQPETSAGSTPTGLRVDVHMPQQESAEGVAEADLRDATVMLPEGMVVNPSSANGLEACSPRPDRARVHVAGRVSSRLEDRNRRGRYAADRSPSARRRLSRHAGWQPVREPARDIRGDRRRRNRDRGKARRPRRTQRGDGAADHHLRGEPPVPVRRLQAPLRRRAPGAADDAGPLRVEDEHLPVRAVDDPVTPERHHV